MHIGSVRTEKGERIMLDREKVIEGLVEIVHFFDILSEISGPCNELKQDAENKTAVRNQCF